MSITLSEPGGLVIDEDVVLRYTLIAALDLLSRVASAWELFPHLEDRRGHMDKIYRDIEALQYLLKQPDQEKGEGA